MQPGPPMSVDPPIRDTTLNLGTLALAIGGLVVLVLLLILIVVLVGRALNH
jgi:hypothetical protein